ncbi:MAG: cytochrome P450 [Solirubrobacterales bacterium]
MEQKIPAGPRAPGAVQSLRWFRDPVKFMERGANAYGGIFRVKLGGMRRTSFIADPELAWPVLSAGPERVRMGSTNGIFRPVLGDNSLFLLDGERHRQHRKLIMPAFHRGSVRRFAGLVSELAVRDIAEWPLGEPFPIQERMRKITLEMILRVVIGVTAAEREQRLRELLHDLLDAVQDPIAVLPQFQYDLGGRTPYAKLMALVARIDVLLRAEISERRYDEGLADRDDVLSMLVAPKPHEDGFLSDREVRDELLTLLVAGHETTATALAWTFERLLRHPDAHRRLREEQAAGVDDSWCDAIVRETLRLRPVLPITARKLNRPVELGGYVFPAGWTLMPCIYLLHRDPGVFEAPGEFRPERFFGPSAPSSRVWLPFGAGPRHCIGQSLSMMAIKVILRTVAQRIELEPANPEPEAIVRRNFTLGPEHGASVVGRRRLDGRPAPGYDRDRAVPERGRREGR